jgi:hypothetical protein
MEIRKFFSSRMKFRLHSSAVNIFSFFFFLAFCASGKVAWAQSDLLDIATGSSAAIGSYAADEDYSGGKTYSTAATINTSNVTNPAPMAVYQHQRYGNFTYTLPGLTPGANCTVRLHFAEIYWHGPGEREENVLINGTQVLTDFDQFAAAGGENIAIVEQFSAVVNSSGQIVIQFVTVIDNASIEGIEIETPAAATPTFSLAAKTYTSAQTVTISDSTPDASIYYTINGTTPTTSSSAYSSPITVSATETLEAIATASGYANSAVGSAAYNISNGGGSDILDINSGGADEGTYLADEYSSGSKTYSTSATINTANVIDPAPEAVYQSQRYGNFTYTLPGLTAGTIYTVRLHFAEIYWKAAGKRIENVLINGKQVLTDFDQFAAAGGENIAIVEQFAAVANSSGQIVIQFVTVTDNASIGGIEISTAVPTFSPAAGVYFSSVAVTINSPSSDATIYYTTDDTTPTSSSAAYSGPITISTTSKVEAIAIESGGGNSEVASATYTILNPAYITSPTPGTKLPGASVPFTWAPGTATHFELWVGTTGVGSSNLYNSGNVTATTETVSDLPSNGQTVNARLYYLINGKWNYTDYTYMATGTPIPAALITSSPLTGSSVTFTWTPGNFATTFGLDIGTLYAGSSSKPNSSDIYSSGSLTGTSVTVNNLPTNGGVVYVQLCSLLNGSWVRVNYIFTASGSPIQPALTSPTPDTSTALTGTSVTFSWTPGNVSSHFEFYLGTSLGSSNLYSSGNVTATTETVSGLPSNGETLHARLYWLIDGGWQYADYTYVASGSPSPAMLTTPAPNTLTPLTGSSVAFTWNPGNTATHFEFWVGTTGVGSSNLYNSGDVTATTETVSGLPSNGATVYARLYWLINGAWQYTDYTYVAF